MRVGGLRLPQITATIGLPPAIPIMTLTFEDFPPGHFGTFGPRRVTREEIIAFAAEFDPQPMHLDEEAAQRSMLQRPFRLGLASLLDHDADDVRRLYRPHRVAGFAGGQRVALACAASAGGRSHARCRGGGGQGLAQPSRNRHRDVQGPGPQRRGAGVVRDGLADHRGAARRRRGGAAADAFLRGHRDRATARSGIVHLHRRSESRNSPRNSIRSAFISTRRKGANRCSAGWRRRAGTSGRSA